MHAIHIHAPATVTLPAHPFTAIGTQSGTVRRAFLTSRPGAVRMRIPVIVLARRNLHSAYTTRVLSRRIAAPDCTGELAMERRAAAWSSLASLALVLAAVALCAAFAY